MIVTKVYCDKCGKEADNYRRETVDFVEYHYCYECLNKYGHECDVCLDTFINLAAHKNRK